MPVPPAHSFGRLRSLVALSALGAFAHPAAAQTTYTWGHGGNTNWLEAANWTGGPVGATPGETAAGLPTDGHPGDIARFNDFIQGSSNGVAIDFGAAGGTLALGAINFASNSISGAGIQIGNSSTTTAGVLRLNGATIGGVPNVLIADTGFTYSYFSINALPNGGTGGPGLTLQLGTSNGVFMSSSSDLFINVPISEAAPGYGFTIRGGFSVVLGQPNTFSGAVRVIGSRLIINRDAALGIAPASPTANRLVLEPDQVTGQHATLYTNAATFEINANRGIAIGPTSGTGDAEIFVPDPEIPGYMPVVTYNGVIANNGAGSGRLIKTGGGVLALGGSSTYSGGTLLHAGELRLTNVNALGATGTVTIATEGSTEAGYPLSAKLMVQATGTFARPIVVNSTFFPNGFPHNGPVTIGTPDFTASVATVFSGGIAVNRPITLQGGNSVETRFTGTFTGTGDLTVSAAAAGRKVVLAPNGTNSFGNLTIAENATLQIGTGFTVISSRAIPDSSSITFQSGARLNLAPEGTDSETVNALNSPAGVGIIETTGGNNTTTFTLSIGANNASGSFGGTIQQGAGKSAIILAKVGTGTQVLTGNNTYTGGTRISAGTLLVNDTGVNSGTGTGSVLVSGGTLGGNGRVAGGVTVFAGGTLRGGDANGVGTLTLGGLTMDAGSVLAVRIHAPGLAGVPSGSGASSDNLANPTNHNYLLVLAGSSLDPGITIVVDGTGSSFAPSMTYSYKVAQLGGNQLGVNVTNINQFTFVGFSVESASLTGDSGGAIYLNFVPAPVPEPAAVLAIAALGLAARIRWKNEVSETPSPRGSKRGH